MFRYTHEWLDTWTGLEKIQKMDVIAVIETLYYDNDVKQYNINSKKNLAEWTQWYLEDS